MKTNLFPAIKLTIATILLFCGAYTMLIWTIAQLDPHKGQGEMLRVNGKKYYANVGQAFTLDKYFHSRPSAAGYNAAGSAGSNKGPSNPEYLDMVQARIDSFLIHNPGIDKTEIPVELITASGSGLDPHISPKAALVQIKRIASLRKLPEEQLRKLVQQNIESPLLNMMGPSKVNVLKLNLALDSIR